MSVAAPSRAVTVKDILKARQVINRHLGPTPVIMPDLLREQLGFSVALKLENLQPIGAFKIRGGVNLVSQLTDEERARGVVSASTPGWRRLLWLPAPTRRRMRA